MNTITDDQIAEIEYLASNATRGDWEFHICEIRANYDSDGYTVIAESPSVPKNWRDQRDTNMRYMATVCPVAAQALIARLREAERWKADASQVLNPLLDYAYSLGLAKLGHSVTESLIEDHKRLREAERDAARYRWLRSRLVGASFDWGEEGTTVLAFEMPPSLSIGADCDRNIDEAMMSAREAAE